eukprot:295393_1
MSAFASASMDKTIVIYDLVQGSVRYRLDKKHARGIFTLAFNQHYHSLFSGGFEHDVLVWDPYCALNICKLQGHFHPIVGICSSEDSPELVTADASGIVKIWDIRNFGCVQTISTADENDDRIDRLTGIARVSRHNRIALASRRLHYYCSDGGTLTERQFADSIPTARVAFNSREPAFLSASGRTVKVWRASTGDLMRVFRDITEKEITSFCLDGNQKKMFLGDASGNIGVYSVLNGSLMAVCYPSHSGEVSECRFVDDIKCVMTSSWDGTVNMYDPSDHLKTPKKEMTCCRLKASMTHHTDEITCMAASTNLSLVATGSVSGKLILWDYITFQTIGILGINGVEITALEFLDPFPLLALADSTGNVFIWAVRPMVKSDGVCLLKLSNLPKQYMPPDPLHIPKKLLEKAVLVVSIEWDADSLSLFTADCTGNIKCWSMYKAVERWGITPFDISAMNVSTLPRSLSKDGRTMSEIENIPTGELSDLEDSESETEGGDGESEEQSIRKKSYAIYRVFHATLCLAAMRALIAMPMFEENQKNRVGKTTGKKLVFKKAVENVIIESIAEKSMEAAGLHGIKLESGDITLSASWNAHTDSIRHICFISDPPSIMSCSFDANVHLWSPTGKLYGTLQQGRVAGNTMESFKPAKWDFPISMDKWQGSQRSRAQNVLSQIRRSLAFQ